MQISCQVDKILKDEIQELADKENRSLSSMGGLLLQQAVKERLRKRNGKKTDTEHYSSDLGESDR
jgi:hypothetical protein